MRTIIVTGVAGFIGFSVYRTLLSQGYKVLGIDNMARDGELLEIMKFRLNRLLNNENFLFVKADLCNNLNQLHDDLSECDTIIHLAASAGVRSSMNNPVQFIKDNVIGFANVLEFARWNKITRVIYASSSSVYGNNTIPAEGLKESERIETPESIYAMTKASDELLAYVYAHTYGIQTIGLRLFSVYGPYGRPDMAPWIFAKSIIEGREVVLYNNGSMKRDFTYIDDVVNAILIILHSESHREVFSIYNIGNSSPHTVLELYTLIEQNLGLKGKYICLEAPAGDVEQTFADMRYARAALGLSQFTPFETGIMEFCTWYKWYYNLMQVKYIQGKLI